MASPNGFVLYHTEGCHLCDIAKDLVDQSQIDYQHLDICDDANLSTRYGTQIPVLAHKEKELVWPFDAVQLQEFIRSLA
jgi:glutaredoxin